MKLSAVHVEFGWVASPTICDFNSPRPGISRVRAPKKSIHTDYNRCRPRLSSTIFSRSCALLVSERLLMTDPSDSHSVSGRSSNIDEPLDGMRARTPYMLSTRRLNHFSSRSGPTLSTSGVTRSTPNTRCLELGAFVMASRCVLSTKRPHVDSHQPAWIRFQRAGRLPD